MNTKEITKIKKMTNKQILLCFLESNGLMAGSEIDSAAERYLHANTEKLSRMLVGKLVVPSYVIALIRLHEGDMKRLCDSKKVSSRVGKKEDQLSLV